MKCPEARALRRLRSRLQASPARRHALSEDHREIAAHLGDELRALQDLETQWRRRLPSGPRLLAFQETLSWSHRWWRSLKLEIALRKAEKAWRLSIPLRRALPFPEALEKASRQLAEGRRLLPAHLGHLPSLAGLQKVLDRAEESFHHGAYEAAWGFLNFVDRAFETWDVLPEGESPESLTVRLRRSKEAGRLDPEPYEALVAVVDEGLAGLACRLLDELVTQNLSEKTRRRSRTTTPDSLTKLRERAEHHRKHISAWTSREGHRS